MRKVRLFDLFVQTNMYFCRQPVIQNPAIMKIRIQNATLVNEGRLMRASLWIDGETIARIVPDGMPVGREGDAVDETVDAEGLFLLPGVVDDHVHFRDPGLTHKADMATESRAAAAGGVTSVMDMPNVTPQTTDLEQLDRKFALGAEKCRVNYSFFFGATNTNTDLLGRLDPTRVCGVKLFMGSSTGNMLVDKREALLRVFRESPTLVMAHCEDTATIAACRQAVCDRQGADPDVSFHPAIRSAEACYRSTALAVELAEQAGARLHVAHVSTARELDFFAPGPLCEPGTDTLRKRLTAEACVAHLLFTDADYARLGTRIKCNPAVKTAADRQALREALTSGRIDVVATDHAPHLLAEKQGGCLRAASGMPMVQFSLVSLLKLVDDGVLTLPCVVERLCHAPARLFGLSRRGFLREGYQADLVLVRPNTPWTLTPDRILSRCGWSPLEGDTFSWQVEQTYCNGHRVYDSGRIDDDYRGQALRFER